MTNAEDAVRRYFAVAADLASVPEDLVAAVTPDFVAVERPNSVTPAGAERDLAATLAGFSAGKALLSHQEIELHEVLVAGDRVAVRSTWRGTVASDAGPYVAGQQLLAEMAGFLTVRDGRVAHHETFDCYPTA